MGKRFLSCLGAAIALISSSAFADLTVGEYLAEGKNHSETVRTYVKGQGDGIAWANAELKDKGYPALFCQSQSLGLSADNLIQLIDARLDSMKAKIERPQLQQFPIGVVLLKGLEAAFPCQ